MVCNQDTGDKVQVLNAAIDYDRVHKRLIDESFEYVFEDKESGHQSASAYRMVVVKK